MAFIEASDLTKHYGRGDSTVRAIEGVNFTVETGEFVGVMGESGCGKSTLLSILGALNTPTRGTLGVADIDVYGLGAEQRADFRREFIGFVFQSFHLIPYLTLAENTMLPLVTTTKSRAEKRAMALAALDRVGLHQKADRLPSQVSGGEQERAAVARAIVNAPPLILADEPTGNLDTRNTAEVMRLLNELNHEGTTVVMVTHSEGCAAHAGRIIRMTDGHIAQTEDAAETIAAVS